MASTQVIDFHVHVFPDYLRNLISSPSLGPVAGLIPPLPVEHFRESARHWLKPFSSALHKTQTLLRHLPEPARNALDQIGTLAPLPSLFFESTLEDLKHQMTQVGIQKAVVIATPPIASTEWLLEICQGLDQFVIAANIPTGTPQPGEALKRLVSQGARLLKINPSMDGEGVDSSRYRSLLRAATELGIPVILHTGCFHQRLFFKDPHLGQAQRFSPWFSTYPQTRFVLAHMNYHEPQIALDLLEEFPNLYVDTSWQPAETIGEAVRRVGAERVLFGSDWPIIGHNFEVGLQRIQQCVTAGTLKEKEAELILSQNALKLLGN